MENALQNFQAPHYVPNTYWDELMDDLQSILDDYSQEQLSAHRQTTQNTDLGLER